MDEVPHPDRLRHEPADDALGVVLGDQVLVIGGLVALAALLVFARL